MRPTRLHALKVKRKTLAAESRIIRAEELRLAKKGRKVRFTNMGTVALLDRLDRTRTDLYLHRIHDVRGHARISHLAHAFLTGRAYATVEGKRTDLTKPSQVMLQNILKDVKTFGGSAYSGLSAKDMQAWMDGESRDSILKLDKEVRTAAE